MRPEVPAVPPLPSAGSTSLNAVVRRQRVPTSGRAPLLCLLEERVLQWTVSSHHTGLAGRPARRVPGKALGRQLLRRVGTGGRRLDHCTTGRLWQAELGGQQQLPQSRLKTPGPLPMMGGYTQASSRRTGCRIIADTVPIQSHGRAPDVRPTQWHASEPRVTGVSSGVRTRTVAGTPPPCRTTLGPISD